LHKIYLRYFFFFRIKKFNNIKNLKIKCIENNEENVLFPFC